MPWWWLFEPKPVAWIRTGTNCWLWLYTFASAYQRGCLVLKLILSFTNFCASSHFFTLSQFWSRQNSKLSYILTLHMPQFRKQSCQLCKYDNTRICTEKPLILRVTRDQNSLILYVYTFCLYLYKQWLHIKEFPHFRVLNKQQCISFSSVCLCLCQLQSFW